jgi:hypothetical protein
VKLKELLDLYAVIARPEILAEASEDSCILSTRVTMAVLDRFGYTAKPLKVTLTLGNAKMVELVYKHGWPESEEVFKQWLDEYPELWTIGIGFGATPDEPGKWPGHLVATVGPYLVDASASQGARPQRGITPPPVIVSEMPVGFITGRQRFPIMHPKGEQFAIYDADPKNLTFKDAPDWTQPDRYMPIAKRIIRKMKETIVAANYRR